MESEKKFYLITTPDELSLPLFCSESREEISEVLGISKNAVSSLLAKKSKRLHKVVIRKGDEEWESQWEQ